MVQERQSYPISPSPPQRAKQYWRWFLPPMLLASLGLHGLVLFSPVAPSEEDLVPPPDPEEDGIAITKIDPPRPRPRAEASANAGTVKTAPPSPRPAPTPAPQQTTQARTAQPARSAATASRRSSARASSTPSGRGRSPAALAQPTPRTSATPTVPDLSSVDNVRNPNTATPNVSSSTAGTSTAAARNASFDQYIKVFEAYNGVKISEEEASTLRASWLESFSDRGPDSSNLDIQPLNDFDPLAYPANICLPSEPEPAQVLVMVNADGEVDEYKQFVQRTGYRNFDSEAAKLIDNHDFPETDSPQAYLAEISVDYNPEDCEWPPSVDKLPDDYFAVLENYVGPELTTPAEAKAAQAAWLISLGEAEDLALPQADELTAQAFDDFEQEVEYPLEICLPIEPEDAQWGVVVKPDGTLAGEPAPLRSTGYKNFDDRSQRLVENFDFPETESPQIYVVEVPIAYNPVNCQPLDSEEFNVPATTAATARGNNSTHRRSSVASSNAADFRNRLSPIAINLQGNIRDRLTPISINLQGNIRDRLPPIEVNLDAVANHNSRATASASRAAATRNGATGNSENLAFNPAQQERLVETGRENVEADSIGSLNLIPDIAVASIEEGWPAEIDQSCFLAELDPEQGPIPVDSAEDALVLSESFDFVPSTLSRLYGTEVADAGEYCGAPLLRMAVGGTPQLFSSTIGFGAGDSNALVVLWSTDPREQPRNGS